MGRQKAYCEEEVIEKAMSLFWRNGYETTSVRMLEKEMGINQFSIYSSFGSKHGVFLESIKCYKKKLRCISDKLKASDKGVASIKQYFYDLLDFSKGEDGKKGCLVGNAMSESGVNSDPTILEELNKFSNVLKDLFKENLKFETDKDVATIERQANYLMISIQGLSQASKTSSRKQLEDFIETTFSNL